MTFPPEYSRQIRPVLAEIVAEHGPEILSRPSTLTSLLADLLPELPRAAARVMEAAARDRVADELRGHVAQGMDTATAVRLAAASFADATLYTRKPAGGLSASSPSPWASCPIAFPVLQPSR